MKPRPLLILFCACLCSGALAPAGRSAEVIDYDGLLVKRAPPSPSQGRGSNATGAASLSGPNESWAPLVPSTAQGTTTPSRAPTWYKVQTNRTKSDHARSVAAQIAVPRNPPNTTAAAPDLSSPSARAWQAAFSFLDSNRSKVASGEILSVEPDLQITTGPTIVMAATIPGKEIRTSSGLTLVEGPLPYWPGYPGPDNYLGDQYSQLASAYRSLPANPHHIPVVAALDIGVLTKWAAFPKNLVYLDDVSAPQRAVQNGAKGQPWFPATNLPNGPEHGTATAAILAGQPMVASGSSGQFNFAGGNPDAKIISIRVGASVVALGIKPLTLISDIARGFVLARDHGAEIISMCIGGFPSQDLADGVNYAYSNGIAIFCASGDYVVARGIAATTPKYVVFPAAYDPVMAVAGVAADERSYGEPPTDWGHMPTSVNSITLGNRGPIEKMQNAIATWCPNVPWVRIPTAPPPPLDPSHPWETLPGSWNSIDLDGSGTSAGCPQVAAAASLILEAKHDEIQQAYAKPWQRAEALYWLLRHTARIPKSGANPLEFGAGFLQAHAALNRQLPSVADLPAKPSDAHSNLWDVLRILFSMFHSDVNSASSPSSDITIASGRTLYRIDQGRILPTGQRDLFSEVSASSIGTEVLQAIESSPDAQDKFYSLRNRAANQQDGLALVKLLLANPGALSPRTAAVLNALEQQADAAR